MSKRNKPDWSKRRSITFPASEVERIEKLAEDRRLPIYQLVLDAVTIFERLYPVEDDISEAKYAEL